MTQNNRRLRAKLCNFHIKSQNFLGTKKASLNAFKGHVALVILEKKNGTLHSSFGVCLFKEFL